MILALENPLTSRDEQLTSLFSTSVFSQNIRCVFFRSCNEVKGVKLLILSVLEQLPPRKIAASDNWPLDDSPRIFAPRRTIDPKDNCRRGNSLQTIAPWIIAPLHHKTSSENNCPHSNNFPQRVLRVN